MTKTRHFGLRADDEMAEALTAAAKEDSRTISSLVTLILRNWLKERGFIEKETTNAE